MTPQRSPSLRPAPFWADGQAQPCGVRQFLLLEGVRHFGQGLLEPGIQRFSIARSRYRVASASASMTCTD